MRMTEIAGFSDCTSLFFRPGGRCYLCFLWSAHLFHTAQCSCLELISKPWQCVQPKLTCLHGCLWRARVSSSSMPVSVVIVSYKWLPEQITFRCLSEWVLRYYDLANFVFLAVCSLCRNLPEGLDDFPELLLCLCLQSEF